MLEKLSNKIEGFCTIVIKAVKIYHFIFIIVSTHLNLKALHFKSFVKFVNYNSEILHQSSGLNFMIHISSHPDDKNLICEFYGVHKNLARFLFKKNKIKFSIIMILIFRILSTSRE